MRVSIKPEILRWACERFARALVVSTLEGRSSFTEAFRLLGFKKMATFNELGHSLEMEF
jgi:hypothetical protein